MRKLIVLALIFVLTAPAVAHASVVANLQKVSGVSVSMGQGIYRQNPNLTAGNAYKACEKAVVSYNAALAGMTPHAKQFLYYMSPAEVTYCWAGYLDAAGVQGGK